VSYNFVKQIHIPFYYQTKAFWPHDLDHALMDINVDGHEYHSVPFNFNKADTLLLKLKGQVLYVDTYVCNSKFMFLSCNSYKQSK